MVLIPKTLLLVMELMWYVALVYYFLKLRRLGKRGEQARKPLDDVAPMIHGDPEDTDEDAETGNTLPETDKNFPDVDTPTGLALWFITMYAVLMAPLIFSIAWRLL